MKLLSPSLVGRTIRRLTVPLVTAASLGLAVSITPATASAASHGKQRNAVSPAALPTGVTVQIWNSVSGRCLDADTNTIASNGTKVQLWDCNGAVQQKWYVFSQPGGSGQYYGLKNLASNRCLDADLNTIGSNGTKVQLWDCNGTSQQTWSENAHANNASELFNVYSWRALDADTNTLANNGTIVQLWDFNYQPQQTWYYKVI